MHWSPAASSTSHPLTCSIGSNIDNFTFCSMNMMIFHHCEGNSLDINGILSPRLQSLQQNSRIVLLVWWQVNINHVPAIGATRILPIILCHIFEWSEIFKERSSRNIYFLPKIVIYVWESLTSKLLNKTNNAYLLSTAEYTRKKKKRYFQAVQNSVLVVNNKTTVSKKTLYLFIFLPKTGSEMLQAYLDFK